MSDASTFEKRFDPRRYSALEYRLERKPDSHISSAELAAAIEFNRGEPIPGQILDYLCKYLSGDIQTKRGPKPKTLWVIAYEVAAIEYYAKMLKWLRQRKKTQGLEGWSAIKDAEWWQGKPAERAARMAQRRMLPNVDWRHIQNLASKYHRN